MVQFQQPIWLWAITGIAVPVIIHLWNTRQGKTRKVGSIAFLTESASTRAKSLKLSELWLLLLRCLLLTMLALLISRPYWEKQPAPKEKGWVLVEKQTVQQAYRAYKPTIDSLLNQGFTFHYFASGFYEAVLADALKTGNDSTGRTTKSYWALLQELNQQVPATLPIYIFTDNRLRNFRGNRPNIAMNVQWHTYPANNTANTWIQSAYETTDDSIRVVMGNSNAGGTYYSWHDISHQTSDATFTATLEKGKTLVAYKDLSGSGGNHTVEADTSTLKICIYTDRVNDAGYLIAALTAIRDLTKHKIQTTVAHTHDAIQAKYDWLFWLSETPMPASLIKNNVFLYEQGKTEAVHTVMLTGNHAVSAGEAIPVYKAIVHADTENNFPVWKNGYGNALLSKDNHDVYHFYSRFDPQWNGMVWNEQFPQVIYCLVFAGKDGRAMTGPEDERIIAGQQLQPAAAAGNTIFHKQRLIQQTDLSATFWLIAFVLFLLERILSYRKKKEEVYG